MELFVAIILGVLVGLAINWLADFLLGNSPTRMKIAWRAPVVLILTALAFAVLWLKFGTSTQTLFLALYTAAFMNVLVTDIEDRAIFPIVLVPATLIALAASPLLPMGFGRALLGGIFAFVIVFGIYAFAGLYSRWRKLYIKGGAFGRGDVYLATFMGLVVGFPAVWLAILYTIFLAGIFIVIFLVYQYIKTKRLALGAVTPYGPFFCIAGWTMMTFQA